MKRIFGRGRRPLTAVLLLALAVVPCAAVEERKVLRVAFPQTKGYSMTAEDGRRY